MAGNARGACDETKESGMTRWGNRVATTEERQDEKRAILIREAGVAFARNGFHSTTLEGVAKSIGVTKAAIYYYFKNKNEILFECHKLAIRIAQEAIDTGEATGQTGFEKLALTIRHYIVGLTSELSQFSFLVDVAALPKEERDWVISYRDKFEARLRGFIEEGIADGSIAPCDPKFAIFAIMGAVSWVPSWYSADGKLSGQDVADKLIGFFANGIGTTSALPTVAE